MPPRNTSNHWKRPPYFVPTFLIYKSPLGLRNPQKKDRHRVLWPTDFANKFNEINSMPARTLCQKFFRGALNPFHQYRQNALLDANGIASPEYLWAGWLARAQYARCSGHFIFIKGKPEDVKFNVPEGDCPAYRQKRKNSLQRKSPSWYLPVKKNLNPEKSWRYIVKECKIEQNFRDEKS